ncbi:MAG TPA: hypothetical protein PKC14_03555 [Candidatus Absconditabacterales bacterium]|nr:hypothetical protein [Candidatus Absconditabacterales bacterium]
MKLKDFYLNAYEDKLTENQKLGLYQQFLQKRNKKDSLMRKISPVTKFLAYSFFILILLFGQYNFPFMSVEKRSLDSYNPNEVMADYIGKIINVQGQFQVLNNGKLIETDIINDGDRIIIGNNSQIIFDINKTTTAKIIGPADVLVKSVGATDGINNYVLNMVEGTYIEVKSEEKSTNNVVLKTKDLNVEPSNLNEKTNYSITQENGRQFIQNRGAELLVQKTINNKRNSTTIKKNQIARVTKEVTVLQEVEKLTLELKNKAITSKFDLGSDVDDVINTASLSSVAASTSTTADEVKPAIALLKTSKKVISVEQTEELAGLLYSSFMAKDIYELAVQFAKGEKNAVQITYSNIAGKLEKSYTVLGLTPSVNLAYPGPELAAGALLKAIADFQKQSQDAYFIGPQITQSLGMASKWLSLLQNKKFGELTEEENLTIDTLIKSWELSGYKF